MTIDRATILAAAARIESDVRRTPLWRLPGSALGLGVAEVWLKLEQLQVGGSFKARGMFNRMRAAELPASGVIIASGGNAGIAVAWAARALGVACEVFVPEVCSAAKQALLAALGARVVVAGAAYGDAQAACVERQRASGALPMHAYDQAEVVAGSGTVGAEIEDEAGLPDRVLVSVGGGGLVAGIAAWFESRTRVEGIEPVLAPTLYAARAAGMPVDVEVSGVAADSLGARRVGAIAWPITQRHLADLHQVDDGAISAAQRRIWGELRLAVEPAAALPLAALWSGAVRPQAHECVAVVLCGANLDPATLR
ncbi:MAG: threonine/serine dehydratase [Burkholderiales bacterium]|nr:threonine/serine dehydratase [Burkholderiales bacterium]MDE2454520.1 threonine/serine dehydratase [Burkholderiales bacterium]